MIDPAIEHERVDRGGLPYCALSFFFSSSS
jgi:hypothetical protein